MIASKSYKFNKQLQIVFQNSGFRYPKKNFCNIYSMLFLESSQRPAVVVKTLDNVKNAEKDDSCYGEY